MTSQLHTRWFTKFLARAEWLVPLAVMLAFFAAIAIPNLLDRYGLQIGIRLMLYIGLAEAWNLLAGYGGLVSLGSAAFVGIGAYVFVGVANLLGFGIVPSFLVGGLAGAVAAALIAPAVFRMRGLYFTVGTLALGEALRLFMVNVPWFGGSRGLYLNIGFPTEKELYIYALALLALVQIIMTMFAVSRLSVVLRSVRDDEDAASQIGVRTFRVKIITLCSASFLMAIFGALQAFRLGAVEPYGIFGLQWSVDILAIVIIGGMGLRFGPIVGAFFVIALGELLADYPEVHIVLTGAILIFVVRFAPRGICGLFEQFRVRGKIKGSEEVA